jgi:hypothetical protein
VDTVVGGVSPENITSEGCLGALTGSNFKLFKLYRPLRQPNRRYAWSNEAHTAAADHNQMLQHAIQLQHFTVRKRPGLGKPRNAWNESARAEV